MCSSDLELSRARGPSIHWKRNHDERHSDLRVLRMTQCQGAVTGAMGLKSHQENWIHVERNGAQVVQAEVHPTGDQYHVEMQAVQNPLVSIPLRVKE